MLIDYTTYKKICNRLHSVKANSQEEKAIIEIKKIINENKNIGYMNTAETAAKKAEIKSLLKMVKI